MDTERLQQFFGELGLRLEMAREVDERLNSELAYRFNVLDYLRTSELGLSRVIADLLNPRATHGQKLLFLDTFLRGLQRSSKDQGHPLDFTDGYGENEKWCVAAESVDVRVERTIRKGRRLDISVVFEGDDKQRRCLAIENKPYAGDQEGQIQAYLDFLRDEYGRKHGRQSANHLLIYLSSSGEMPSKRSLDQDGIDDAIGECDFAVMGYSVEGTDDSSEGEETSSESPLLLDYSLADWFDACRRECDVERLRNFLRDAKAFCRQHFGGAAMSDTTQIATVIEVIRRDRKHAKVAQLVAQAFPRLRNLVQRCIYDEVSRELRKFFRPPEWNLLEHRGRLRLHEKGHESKREFSGVWLMWANSSTLAVGVEWRQNRGTDLDEGVHECFRGAGVEAGQREPGGGSGGPTWWIAGQLAGDKWVGGDDLLIMADDEVRQFARATGDLMKRLAEVLKRADDA